MIEACQINTTKWWLCAACAAQLELANSKHGRTAARLLAQRILHTSFRATLCAILFKFASGSAADPFSHVHCLCSAFPVAWGMRMRVCSISRAANGPRNPFDLASMETTATTRMSKTFNMFAGVFKIKYHNNCLSYHSSRAW